MPPYTLPMASLVDEREVEATTTAVPAAFTQEELDGIAELRSRLQTKISSKPDESLEKIYFSEDTTMWRYLLAQSQESEPLEKSEEMFLNSIKWREDIKMFPTLWTEWRGNKTESYIIPRATTARARLGDLIFYSGIMDEMSATAVLLWSKRWGWRT